MNRHVLPLLLALWAGGAMAQGLPVDLGGPYSLTNQYGETRTEADPDGNLQLIFFGYANCDAICTMALPQMGVIQDILAERGVPISTVMITIDGERDRPDNMAGPLAAMHPALIGLTGSAEALAAVHQDFQINIEHLFDDPEYGPIFAHDSNYYVLSGSGDFLTVLPPILPPEQFADILEGYAQGS